MRLIPVEKLIELQEKTCKIRNICILAHVDHGKTTLADSLVASNGIMSARMVGKMRYMDNLPDEQERGITMKSSAIALYFSQQESQYLINLIDSPGHIDFCAEVSTAVRTCDGALIVVDVVEGVCPQTHAVLRQAWNEGLKPLLILNKLDRLILELKMTPTEMYKQLSDVLGQVNAVAGGLFMSKVIENDEKLNSTENQKNGANENPNADLVDDDVLDDEHLYFTPENGNIIFASAYDGWGFRIEDFAKIWSEKANINESVLRKTLWGDFYLDTKLKRVRKGAFAKGKKPLFVQMILDNIWSIYDAVIVQKDKEKCEKMVKSLNLTIAARDIKHQDPKIYLQAVFQQWLPLAGAVLTAVCQQLPSPLDIGEERAKSLMFSKPDANLDSVPDDTFRLMSDVVECSSRDDRPTIVFVSKVFAVESKSMPANRTRPLTADEIQDRRKQILDQQIDKQVRFDKNVDVKVFDDDVKTDEEFTFLAFARVYSGCLRRGQILYILPPTHDPSLASSSKEYLDSLCKFEVSDLYLMMGRDMESVQRVSAGNIVAVAGLQDLILKSATLSDTPMCPAFGAPKFYAEPIVRVSIEPRYASDMQALVQGLRLLNQADPCVRTYVEDTGEQVLVTAGEVHLQRCLADLTSRFSKIELNVSEPIIPFMETIVPRPTVDRVQETIQSNDSACESGKQSVEIKTSNKQVLFRVKAQPLPESVVKILESHVTLLKLIEAKTNKFEKQKKLDNYAEDTLKKLEILQAELTEAFETAGKQWKGTAERLWSFGPKKARYNLLVNRIPDYDRPNVWQACAGASCQGSLRDFDQGVISGFQMRCRLGPLCEEPLKGVAFVVEEWTSQTVDQETKDAYGPLSGQIIASVKEVCKLAFQAQPQRLMAAMYSCVIHATSEVLGRVYAVLSKRGGRVVGEEMNEGANLFQISATLPVVESFGFCDEIRKRTSGLASPQLVFSHWEVIDIDPFWVPTTVEELSHFGEKADSENRARKYMNAVRKRKGLATDEKIVESAEKQRTLGVKK